MPTSSEVPEDLPNHTLFTVFAVCFVFQWSQHLVRSYCLWHCLVWWPNSAVAQLHISPWGKHSYFSGRSYWWFICLL